MYSLSIMVKVLPLSRNLLMQNHPFSICWTIASKVYDAYNTELMNAWELRINESEIINAQNVKYIITLWPLLNGEMYQKGCYCSPTL